MRTFLRSEPEPAKSFPWFLYTDYGSRKRRQGRHPRTPGTKNLSLERSYRWLRYHFHSIPYRVRTASMPVLPFLNFYNLSGKTIYTFWTAVSRAISGSPADIRSDANGANIVETKRFSHNDESGGKSWIASIYPNQPSTLAYPALWQKRLQSLLISKPTTVTA